MFVWLLGTASASVPVAFVPEAVHQITWARPFRLEAPIPYRHASPSRMVQDGWLVELRVEPSAMRARAIGVPVLWIGRDLAVRTHWDDPVGCAVVWVPGTHDLHNEPVFFGSGTLPEQMTAERGAAEQQQAVRAGVKPLPAAQVLDVQEQVITVPHEAALLALAKQRSDRCGR